MTNDHGLMLRKEMVLAFLDGWKNQTRRLKGLQVVNDKPDEWVLRPFLNALDETQRAVFTHRERDDFHLIKPPYGGIGNTLHFKETWKMYERETDGKDFLHYRADDAKIFPYWWTENDWCRPDPVWFKQDVFHKWRPSMFMPRICSRFRDVPILDLRIERLNDISEQDALGEGVDKDIVSLPGVTAITCFRQLWNSINGKTAPWESNPWVWVYVFKRYEKENEP